jgi:hypothetical protein
MQWVTVRAPPSCGTGAYNRATTKAETSPDPAPCLESSLPCCSQSVSLFGVLLNGNVDLYCTSTASAQIDVRLVCMRPNNSFRH